MFRKQRVHCFIDGYNFYYPLYEFAVANNNKGLVWCDLYELSRQFIDATSREIEKIYYCSAKYEQRNEQRKVQQAYINYHKKKYNHPPGEMFEAIWGQFAPKTYRRSIKCPSCSHQFPGSIKTQREKRTDINLACLMLGKAYEKAYDLALLISGDKDFIPLLDWLHKLRKGASDYPDFIILIPPEMPLYTFGQHAAKSKLITKNHLEKAAFPPPRQAPEPSGLLNQSASI